MLLVRKENLEFKDEIAKNRFYIALIPFDGFNSYNTNLVSYIDTKLQHVTHKHSRDWSRIVYLETCYIYPLLFSEELRENSLWENDYSLPGKCMLVL